jgi:hypothetical protein
MITVCHENNSLIVCSDVGYWLTINVVHVAVFCGAVSLGFG